MGERPRSPARLQRSRRFARGGKHAGRGGSKVALRRTVIRPAVLVPLLLLLALISSTGCAATAQFHSKTGREFAPVARQAVVCTEQDVAAVVKAGGVVIGSVSAQAFALTATADDVTDKAARIAADSGGTHVLLTEKGVETYVHYRAAEKTTTCEATAHESKCKETYSPPSESTYTKPTERFVVFRVAPERWAMLADGLRPEVAR